MGRVTIIKEVRLEAWLQTARLHGGQVLDNGLENCNDDFQEYSPVKQNNHLLARMVENSIQ